MIRLCNVCGKEFEAIHPNSRYCSDLCCTLARKSKEQAWRDRNKGYITLYMREYRVRKKFEKPRKNNITTIQGTC